MKKIKKAFIILLTIILPIILSYCSKYKEPAPFFDTLFLEYDWGSGIKHTYNVNIIDNNRFKIIKTEKRGILGDKIRELFVDTYGRVYKSNYKPYEGKFSPIWIPAHKMEIGNKFDGRNIITGEKKWKKWNVIVVKDTPTGAENYYDLNTGFWVGSFAKTAGRSVEGVLVDTNVDIPVEGIDE